MCRVSGMRLESPAGLVAVDAAGHHDIHQDEIGLFALAPVARLLRRAVASSTS